MTYYTLLEKSAKDGLWYPQFGAHDRTDVTAERDYAWNQRRLYESGLPRAERTKKTDAFKILRTATARQGEIDKAIAVLNVDLQTQKGA